jgi:hypothetical protein
LAGVPGLTGLVGVVEAGLVAPAGGPESDRPGGGGGGTRGEVGGAGGRCDSVINQLFAKGLQNAGNLWNRDAGGAVTEQDVEID